MTALAGLMRVKGLMEQSVKWQRCLASLNIKKGQLISAGKIKKFGDLSFPVDICFTMKISINQQWWWHTNSKRGK